MTEHPFLIRIRLRDGRVREAPAASLGQARDAVARLAARPGVDEVCWMVHPGAGGPVRLAGRYTAAVPGIGAWPRVAHLFLVAPGMPIGPDDSVTALCGEPIRTDQLDILAGELAGDLAAPCYRCRARTPVRERAVSLPAPRGDRWPA
jgi:hypothetical protein